MLIELLLITIGVLLLIIAAMAYEIGHYKAFVLFDSEHYEARIQCLLDRSESAEEVFATYLKNESERTDKIIAICRTHSLAPDGSSKTVHTIWSDFIAKYSPKDASKPPASPVPSSPAPTA